MSLRRTAGYQCLRDFSRVEDAGEDKGEISVRRS